jgi:Sec-independent protein translocase protein TatA
MFGDGGWWSWLLWGGIILVVVFLLTGQNLLGNLLGQ